MVTIRQLLADPTPLRKLIEERFPQFSWAAGSWNSSAVDQIILDAFDRISGDSELHNFQINQLEGGLGAVINECIQSILSDETYRPKSPVDTSMAAFDLFAMVINEVIAKAEMKLATRFIVQSKIAKRLRRRANLFMREHPTFTGRLELEVQISISQPDTTGRQGQPIHEEGVRLGDPRAS